MVLSDRLGGAPRPSIVRKTALYVLGFGLGALAVAVVLSFALVSATEGAFAGAQAVPEATAGATVEVIGAAPDKRAARKTAGSKARAPRVTPTKTDTSPE